MANTVATIASAEASAIVEPAEILEIVEPDNSISNFTDFCLSLPLMSDIISGWKFFEQPDGICFYRLERDERFQSVNFEFRILINHLMKVKMYNKNIEAASLELDWILSNCHLQTWNQFNRIMKRYSTNVEIIEKTENSFHLKQAIMHVDNISSTDLERKAMLECVKEDLIKFLISEPKDIIVDPYNEYIDDVRKSNSGYKNNDPLSNADEIKEEPIDCIQDMITESAIENERPCMALQDNFEVNEETEDEENSVHGHFCQSNKNDAACFQNYCYTNDKGNKSSTKRQSKVAAGSAEIYQCIDCSRNFRIESQLTKHLEKHEFKTPEKCKDCNEEFRSLYLLNSHERKVHRNVSLLVCEICGRSIKGKKSYERHKNTHFSDTKRQCPFCPLLVTTGALSRHINGQHKKLKPYACSICSKVFTQSGLRNVHEKTHKINEAAGAENMECNECKMKFTRLSSLRLHMRHCSGVLRKKRKIYKYNCSVCNSSFYTRKQAGHHVTKEHRIEITNLNKFCFECNAEVEDYVMHVRQHSCPYECCTCLKRFLTDEKLKEHVKKFHQDSTERNFKCQEHGCSARFKNENHLRAHRISRHPKNDDKYLCDFCSRTFRLKYLLNSHLKICNKPGNSFKCFLCASTYKSLESLKQHSRIHHKTDCIYYCSDCTPPMRYRLFNELKLHRNNEHGTSSNICTKL